MHGVDRRDPNQRQVYLHADQLEGIIERAYAKGFQTAVASMGMDYDGALADVSQFKDIMSTYRAAKKLAIKSIVDAFGKIVTTAVVVVIIGYVGWKSGFAKVFLAGGS